MLIFWIICWVLFGYPEGSGESLVAGTLKMRYYSANLVKSPPGTCLVLVRASAAQGTTLQSQVDWYEGYHTGKPPSHQNQQTHQEQKTLKQKTRVGRNG